MFSSPMVFGVSRLCILDHAPAIGQAPTNNALDVIIQSCIKMHDEPIDDEIEKIKLKPVSYGNINFGQRGLIVQIYNGSTYNITSITIGLVDKKTNEPRSYRYDEFDKHYRLPPGTIVSAGASPQFRRFIKSLTSDEYELPLELSGVSAEEFFKRYGVSHFTARGVR